MTSTALRLGVIGAEHLHLFEMVNGLVEIGAQTIAHAATDGPLTEMFEGWRSDSERRTEAEVLADDTLDLILICTIPAQRGAVALAALKAGHHVLVAKPAVTTPEDLAAIDAAATAAGRHWWPFFSERLTNRGITRAVELVADGAIGTVVSVTGLAPHTLAPEGRPPWFFDPALSGGVLIDLAAHQADQLLALAGPGVVDVLGASVGNVANPSKPTMQDIGRMSLRHTSPSGAIVLSDHHVDWLSPAGLGTWGDVRLMVTGTEGTIEVRSNIDVAGQPEAEHLILVNATSAERVDTTAVPIDWAERLAADIAESIDPSDSATNSFMDRHHATSACDITLRAQLIAESKDRQ